MKILFSFTGYKLVSGEHGFTFAPWTFLSFLRHSNNHEPKSNQKLR